MHFFDEQSYDTDYGSYCLVLNYIQNGKNGLLQIKYAQHLLSNSLIRIIPTSASTLIININISQRFGKITIF